MHEPVRSGRRPARLRTLATVAVASALAATTAPLVDAAGPSTSGGIVAYLSADRSSVHLVAPDGSGDQVIAPNAIQPSWGPAGAP
jgi:hypothetical protein